MPEFSIIKFNSSILNYMGDSRHFVVGNLKERIRKNTVE